ncbi:MAG: hypothetical protein WDN06_15015 [Asticcacaulis sp.]
MQLDPNAANWASLPAHLLLVQAWGTGPGRLVQPSVLVDLGGMVRLPDLPGRRRRRLGAAQTADPGRRSRHRPAGRPLYPASRPSPASR